MPDLDFRVESAAAVPFAATPMLGFRIAVANAKAAEPVYSVSLRCQIQIEVTRRRYTSEDQERLRDLFHARAVEHSGRDASRIHRAGRTSRAGVLSAAEPLSDSRADRGIDKGVKHYRGSTNEGPKKNAPANEGWEAVKDFYGRLLQGEPRADALRQAQLAR